MRALRFSLFLILFSAVTAFEARAINYEYKWTGGAAGFAGTIILDSDFSAGGSLANIVSGQITTLEDTFIYDPSTALMEPVFTWNPTEITYMRVVWSFTGGAAGFGANYDQNGTPVSFVASQLTTYSVDGTGSWKAVASTVPDASSTSLLLTLGLVSLVALKTRKRALR